MFAADRLNMPKLAHTITKSDCKLAASVVWRSVSRVLSHCRNSAETPHGKACNALKRALHKRWLADPEAVFGTAMVARMVKSPALETPSQRKTVLDDLVESGFLARKTKPYRGRECHSYHWNPAKNPDW